MNLNGVVFQLMDITRISYQSNPKYSIRIEMILSFQTDLDARNFFLLRIHLTFDSRFQEIENGI